MSRIRRERPRRAYAPAHVVRSKCVRCSIGLAGTHHVTYGHRSHPHPSPPTYLLAGSGPPVGTATSHERQGGAQ